MSSDVVYNCVTCSNTVKGKQHYVICVSCSRRVHRKCYGQVLSNDQWARIRRTFTCTECVAGSIGQQGRSVPTTTVKYEIFICASQKGGELVTDSCGYAYGFYKDFPSLRVWRCDFRGCVKFRRCYSTLKQIKRPGIDFLRNYSQEDFTLNAEEAHSHPPNYGVEERRLTVGQSCSVQLCSTPNGPSFNLENISACLPARASAVASIDYQDTHLTNPEVNHANKDRCRDQRQANKQQSVAFTLDELFGGDR
jgi:acetone carboxylase gamma subunit